MILKFEVNEICNCCKFLDWNDENDELEPYLICKKSGNEVEDSDSCDAWRFDKILIKDTFWIEKIVK